MPTYTRRCCSVIKGGVSRLLRLTRFASSLVLVLVLLAMPQLLAAQVAEIKYLAHTTNQSEIALYRGLADTFQEMNPNIEVEILTPSGAWLEQLKVMIAGGTPPDAIFAPNWWIPELVENDLIRDISNFASSDPGWNDSDFFPVTIEQTFYKGRRYAVPRHFSPMLIFFNRSMFQESGLGDPPSDWNWDEFKEYAQRLTRRENDQTQQWGFRNVEGGGFSGNAYMIPLVRSFGGDLFSEDGRDLELASPTSTAAVQWFVDLTIEDGVSPTRNEMADNGGAIGVMTGQKVGMTLDIFPAIMNLRNANVSFDWDVAQVPTGPAGRVNRAASGVHAVVKASEHPEAAWKWIKFLGSSKAQQAFASSGLVMGARIDSAIVDTLLIDNAPPKNLRLFMDGALDAQPYPMTPFYNDAVAAIRPAMDVTWRGERSFQLAIQEVKSTVEAILRQ